MATLPKSVKDELIAALDSPFGRAVLMCDGHRITLEVWRSAGKAMSYKVCVFVDGLWKGEWCSASYQGPEQKFARRTERSLYSRKELEAYKKAAPAFGRVGSAERKKYEAALNKKFVWFDPTFATGRAAINHLLRVSVSVCVPAGKAPAGAREYLLGTPETAVEHAEAGG